MEREIIQSVGFRNLVEDGVVTGFQFKVRLPYYRGVFLSQLRTGDLIVDGQRFDGKDLIWNIRGEDYTTAEMACDYQTHWSVTQPAVIKVKKPGGLESGYHDVDIKFGWICNYIGEEMEDPDYGINFHGFNNTRRLLLV